MSAVAMSGERTVARGPLVSTIGLFKLVGDIRFPLKTLI